MAGDPFLLFWVQQKVRNSILQDLSVHRLDAGVSGCVFWVIDQMYAQMACMLWMDSASSKRSRAAWM